MTLRPLATLALAALVSGCAAFGGGGEPEKPSGPLRFDAPVPAPGARIAIQAASVEVREVTLPLYAGLEEIYTQGPDGALRSSTDILWADDPAQAVTQGLAGTLAEMTGKIVAAEPWPFDAYPDVRLDVRFDRMLADAQGRLRLSGQYFIAPISGFTQPEARPFDITVPFQPGNTADLARARGQGLSQLAVMIARGGL